MRAWWCVGSALVLGWCAGVSAQCGSSGGVTMDMKKVMMNMRNVTLSLIEADSKMGEKKPDAKEAKMYQTQAAKMAYLNGQMFKCLNNDMQKMAARKLQKGVNDLMKNAKNKDSAGIHDGISQIRAACCECHSDKL